MADRGYIPQMPTMDQEPQQATTMPQKNVSIAGSWMDPGSRYFGDPRGAAAGMEQQQQRDQQLGARQQRVTQQTAPPENPREALDMQFYGAQDAQRRNEQMLQQAMDTYGQARGEAQQSHAQSQQRNEGLMREGLQMQQAEAARAEAVNQEMMRQRQATLQWMFGLLRRGGEGSLRHS